MTSVAGGRCRWPTYESSFTFFFFFLVITSHSSTTSASATKSTNARRTLDALRELSELDLGDFLSFAVEPDKDHPMMKGDGMVYEGQQLAHCLAFTSVEVPRNPPTYAPTQRLDGADVARTPLRDKTLSGA